MGLNYHWYRDTNLGVEKMSSKMENTFSQILNYFQMTYVTDHYFILSNCQLLNVLFRMNV